MRRRSLGTAVTAAVVAALVGVPALPASAGPESCPADVKTAQGPSRSWADLSSLMETSAAAHTVPAPVVKALAYSLSRWTQFGSGGPRISAGDGCRVGIMDVDVTGRPDGVQLASDIAYNIDEGAKLLRAHWDASQAVPPPADSPADDPDVIENWYHAICDYAGCGADDPDGARVAGILADPFASVDGNYWPWIRPAGFTLPGDVHPAYTHPGAFQARHTATGGSFVFYDVTTGEVTATVPARTHRLSAPPVVDYGPLTIGPDTPRPPGTTSGVTCGGCDQWQLVEGAGRSGRARRTTAAASPTASITWYTVMPIKQSVRVYVPSLGIPLGTATYRIYREHGSTSGPVITVDQDAAQGRWVTLGTFTMGWSGRVVLDNASSVAGQTLVADAVRFVPVPGISLESYVWHGNVRRLGQPVDYGRSHGLDARFYAGQGVPVANRRIKIYRRYAGTYAWTQIGIWTTNADGMVSLTLSPAANVQYTARFVSPTPDLIAGAASNNTRVVVKQVVRASLARTSIRSGETVGISTSVAPSHRGQAVHLQRQFDDSRGNPVWKTVLSRTLSSSSTATFRFPFHHDCCREPEYRFRIYKPADPDHALGLSRELVLHVAA